MPCGMESQRNGALIERNIDIGYLPLDNYDGLYVKFVYWFKGLKVECILQVKDVSPNGEGYY